MCTPKKQRRVAKIFITLIAYTGIAVGWDLKSWRIPNIYVICGMLAGILTSLVFQGRQGLVGSVTGILIPVVVLFILFLLKAIGGGDIKLFSAVGSFVGTDIGFIMLYSFIAGGILSLLYLLRVSFKSITNRNHNSKTDGDGEKNRKSPLKARIHFSIAIFIGTACYVVLKHM